MKKNTIKTSFQSIDLVVLSPNKEFILAFGEMKSGTEKQQKLQKRLEVINFQKRTMLYFFNPTNKIKSIAFADDSSFFCYLTKEGISVCKKSEKHQPTFYQLPDAKTKKYLSMVVIKLEIFVL